MRPYTSLHAHICMFSVLASNYFLSDMLGFFELKHFLQLSSVAEYNSVVVTEEADTLEASSVDIFRSLVDGLDRCTAEVQSCEREGL